MRFQVREQIVLNNLKREETFDRQYSSIMEGKALAARIKKQQDLEEQAALNKKVCKLNLLLQLKILVI
jgi:hypothetical protein